jgi:periplasmic divalent cation tolerance protein
MENEYCQVVTTVGSRADADELARGVVEARLAACAQVLGPLASTYWWHEAIETAEEWQVVFKTTTVRFSALRDFIRIHHDYEVPEILCVPVLEGNPAYLRWIDAETAA